MNVQTFEIAGWKNTETGLVLLENNDWVITKHIPVDYVIDGYKIYNKKWIKSRESNEKEEQIAHVLALKQTRLDLPDVKFSTAHDILVQVQQNYGLFEFQDEVEDELFYGKLRSFTSDTFQIGMIDSKGIMDNNFEAIFKFNDIRTITFESDYFLSMGLLYKSVQQKM